MKIIDITVTERKISELLDFMKWCVDRLPSRPTSTFSYVLTVGERRFTIEVTKRHSNSFAYRSRYFWSMDNMGNRDTRGYIEQQLSIWIDNRCLDDRNHKAKREDIIASIDAFIADWHKELSDG